MTLTISPASTRILPGVVAAPEDDAGEEAPGIADDVEVRPSESPQAASGEVIPRRGGRSARREDEHE